jgi:serine/threonine protein kinase
MGYQFGEKVGEGTSGYVMEAEFKNLKLVCKYMRKDLLSANGRRFLPRELEIAQIVQHPNIVHTHSIIQEAKYYYIFMERCKTDLLSFIGEHGAMEEHKARVWFAQMVEGLKYMHTKHIAHRDLKLENVFISEENTIKVGL